MKTFSTTDRELHNLWPGTYSVSVGSNKTAISSVILQAGGVYTIVLGDVKGKPVRISINFL